MTRGWRRVGVALGGLSMAALAPAWLGSFASAQTVVEDGVVTRMEAAPARLEGVDVLEHLDERLPLDLQFSNTEGHAVTLAQLVDGSRPVIFTLNYSNCPMLCSLQLSGLVQVLGKLELTLGEDFDVVTVSLDPAETSERASETADRYHADYARERQRAGLAAESGPAELNAEASAWQFLTGDAANVKALARALGVAYAYNEVRKEYVHPAVLMVSTPDGRIARYLYGVEYHPKTLSLSLIEAAQGKIGSSVDRLILYCFHYDETEGRYAPVAMNIMRLGGGLTAVALATFLGAFWFRKDRRRGHDAERRQPDAKGLAEGEREV